MKVTVRALTALAAASAVIMVSAREVSAEYRANRARQLAAQGGLVTKVTPGKVIRVVNAQKIVPEASLNEVAVQLTGMLSLPVELTASTETDPARLLDGKTAAVVIVREAGDSSRLLVAPEDCWAVVNVTALRADSPDVGLLQIRTAKEVCRAMALVLGASDSMMQPCLMTSIRSLKDLDDNPCVRLSPYPCNKMIENAGRLGVEMRIRTTYKRACEEGWAPAPTNDVQKAIWEKVKADKERGPTSPIRIKPPNQKKSR